MARNVQKELARAISRNLVVMTTKTKPRAEGGRQLVSVGPYVEAVKGTTKKYALITKQDVFTSIIPATAAQNFIDFVGRDLAWNALRRAYSKLGHTDEVARLDRSV